MVHCIAYGDATHFLVPYMDHSRAGMAQLDMLHSMSRYLVLENFLTVAGRHGQPREDGCHQFPFSGKSNPTSSQQIVYSDITIGSVSGFIPSRAAGKALRCWAQRGDTCNVAEELCAEGPWKTFHL